MPTSPAEPNSSDAIERLTLSVVSPRGAAMVAAIGIYSICFDAQASTIGGLSQVCACFEVEASGIGGIDACSTGTCYCAADQ